MRRGSLKRTRIQRQNLLWSAGTDSVKRFRRFRHTLGATSLLLDPLITLREDWVANRPPYREIGIIPHQGELRGAIVIG